MTLTLRFLPLVFILILIKSLDCQNVKRRYSSRLNFFDTDLLRALAEEKRGNIIVSPASIKSLLAMILEGAVGSTAEEIRTALRLSPDKEEFREQLNLYLSVLQEKTPGVTLQNTNSLFISKKMKVKREYELLIRNVYLSDVCYLDFTYPFVAAEEINAWVYNRTDGLIESVVEPVHINTATDIILTNSLYFKSPWKIPFNPRLTTGACFKNHGVCRQVAMMELHTELKYAFVDALRAHAVELPYKGGRHSMVILLPRERDGCLNMIRDLPYVSLHEISKLMEPTDVLLSLPKFNIDYSDDFVDTLKTIRINTLFTSKANLSGIFEESTMINNIFHKVHLSVDEGGTVAAAASSAMVIPLIESGVQLIVDRPFVFFIRDNDLGLVLFEGKIEEPTEYIENIDEDRLRGRFSGLLGNKRRRG